MQESFLSDRQAEQQSEQCILREHHGIEHLKHAKSKKRIVAKSISRIVANCAIPFTCTRGASVASNYPPSSMPKRKRKGIRNLIYKVIFTFNTPKHISSKSLWKHTSPSVLCRHSVATLKKSTRLSGSIAVDDTYSSNRHIRQHGSFERNGGDLKRSRPYVLRNIS